MTLPTIQINLNLQGETEDIAQAFTALMHAIIIVGIMIALCTCRWFNVHYVVHHKRRQHEELPTTLDEWREL